MEITSQELKRATARAKRLQAKNGTVTSATFDPATRNIIVQLSTGIGIFFSPEDAQGLEDATPAQLSEIEITPLRPRPPLPPARCRPLGPVPPRRRPRLPQMDGRRLGAAGGSKTSTAKAAAARANGSLGGRPRRSTAS